MGWSSHSPASPALDDALTGSVQRVRPGDQVVAFSDLAAILELEQARDLVGCDDVSCTAEIGLALDADLVVLAAHDQFGARRYATLKLLDARSGEVVERIQTHVPARDDWVRVVHRMVRWLFLSVGDRALARNETLDQWGARLRHLAHDEPVCRQKCLQSIESRRGDIEFLLRHSQLPPELESFRPLLEHRHRELSASARRLRANARGPMIRSTTLRRGPATQRWVTIEPEP